MSRVQAPWKSCKTAVPQRRRRLFLEPLEDRSLLAEILYTGAAGGRWDIAANWNLNRVPAVDDTVIISNLMAAQSIEINTVTAAVASVTSSGRIDINPGGTLHVNGTLQAVGNVFLAGGVLRNAIVNSTTSVILTGDGGTLQGVTAQGAVDGSAYLSSATITEGLTLNGGTVTLGDNAILAFVGTQTLGGTNGTVVFNALSLGGYSNALLAASNDMTLTIDSGVTIRGGGTTIYGSSIGASNHSFFNFGGSNTSIVNKGKIVADRSGGMIWLSPNGGTLTNEGELKVDGGSLGLGGNTTIASLGIETPGRLVHTGAGGGFHLSGFLDNTGTTLPLSAAVGSFYLSGGTVQNGAITSANGARLILTKSRGTLTNVVMNGDIDAITSGSGATITQGLTLNGGTMTLGEDVVLRFNGTQTLGGTNGTVVFNNVSLSGYSNGLVATADNMTLTIDAGITIRGGAGGAYGSSIGASNAPLFNFHGSNTSIVNRGKIIADRAGGTIWVRPNGGALTNEGELKVDGGILGLGGNMTIASLGILTPGRVVHTGGSGAFHLFGNLNNTGTTLPLSPAVGSWHLAGGTIQNGTVTTTGTAKLILTVYGGTLQSVAFTGEMDGTTTGAKASIVQGLTLNGATVTLGDDAGLLFNGAQTLGGTSGTIILNQVVNSGNSNGLIATADNMTLTIDAGITVRGGTSGSWGSSIGISDDTFTFGSPRSNVAIVNRGTITSDRVGGTIWVRPNGGTLTNEGELKVDGGNLGLGGNMTIASLGVLTPGRLIHTGGSGAFHLIGTLNNTGTTLPLSSAIGSWYLNEGTIQNGSVTMAGNTKLFLTTGGGTLSNVTLTGELDGTTTRSRATITQGLTLNSGTVTLGDDAGLLFNGTQTLGGTNGTVVLNQVVSSGNSNGLIASADNMTLTIDSGITVRGGTSGSWGSAIGVSNDTFEFGTQRTNVAIVNRGKIISERVGGAIWVRPNLGTLTNEGELKVDGGILGLGGNMTIASLGVLTPGRLIHTGGSGAFHLIGTLNNTGTTLPLNSAIGSWHLNGGTIQNGSVTMAGNTKLLLTTNGGILNNVTLTGQLDGTTTRSRATITQGLTLNDGTVTLGDDAGLYFNGTQTLGGTDGTVVFNQVVSSGNSNALIASADNMTLTIDTGITIRGGTSGSWGSSIGASNDTFEFGSARSNTSVVNRGRIIADQVGGAIWIRPTGGTLNNEGELRVAGGDIGLGGNTTIASLGVNTAGRLVHTGGSGAFHLIGTLNNTGTTLALNSTIGSWHLSNGTIQNGIVTTANNTRLVLTPAGGTLSNVTLTGQLDGTVNRPRATMTQGLTLDGGTVTLGDDAALLFNGTQTLGGSSGTVVFNPVANAGNSNGLLASADNMTLTIDTGITIRGGTGGNFGSSIGASNDTFEFGSARSNASIVNRGRIIADQVGGTIWIRPTGGSLTNEGEFRVAGGNIGLGGNMTVASLGVLTPGRFVHTGGSGGFHLAGTLNNTGTTLPLTSAIGSWFLSGGTIQNGTVTTANNTRLVLTTSGGTLTNVTISGELDAMTTRSRATITQGLALDNGLIQLGEEAALYFNGNQTLGGANGTVIFTPASYTNALITSANNMTLTIGSGVTIRGGALQGLGSSIGASTDFFLFGSASTNTSIINNGTILADGPSQAIVIRPNGGTFTNNGTISAQNGGLLHTIPSVTAGGPGAVTSTSSGKMQFSGNLLTTATTTAQYNLPGVVIMSGNNTTTSPVQSLETPAQDLGNVAAGYSNNFAFQSLVLQNRARVRLVNNSDNSPGTGNEAVYVDTLVLSSGTVLDLNGLNLYTRSVSMPGATVTGGSVFIVPEGSSILPGTPTSGSISAPGQVDTYSFVAGPGQTITLVVNPGSGGANPPAVPYLNNVRVVLLDPNGIVIADLTNSISGGVCTLTESDFTVAGNYSIRIMAPAGSSTTTGNYSLTIWNSTPTSQSVIVNQTFSGNISSPYTINSWIYAGVAGQDVQFDLLTSSTAGITYTLLDPNGQVVTSFNQLTGDSPVVTLQTTGNYTLVVSGNNVAIGTYSFQLLLLPYVPLRVTSLAHTSTGFVASFNRQLNPAQLSLYVAQPDILLTGTSTGSVRGSVAVAANFQQLTFIKTAGLLSPDDYTVRLRSAADGVVDQFNFLLDGDDDGYFGGDYQATFTVTAADTTGVVVSVPNFARGPQQAVHLPANSTTGIPLTLSDGSGITSATLEIRYNPTLLNLTTASVASGLPAGAAVNLTFPSAGVAAISFTSPTPLPAGAVRIVNLHGTIPTSATYRGKQILDIANVSLNGGSVTAIDDDAIQVVAYFGDTTANGTYSGQDASNIAYLSVGAGNGLDQFRLLDPVIMADITGNGGISSSDTTRILQAAVALAVPEVPALPIPAVSLVRGGPDPKLSIPTNLTGARGENLTIPVLIDSIVDLTGDGLQSADLVIYFDPTVFELTSVALGSLLQPLGNWVVASRIDQLAGRVFISLGGQLPLEGRFNGELVQLPGKVKTDAPAGATPINLAESSRDPSRFTQLNEGYLTLIPAPTDAADDPIDGLLTITTSSGQSRPTMEREGDRWRLSGTKHDDLLLVAPLADLIRVRVNNHVLGEFPKTAQITIDGQQGNDTIIIAGESWAPIQIAADLDPEDIDLIYAPQGSLLADSMADNISLQSPTDPAAVDLVLLGFLNDPGGRRGDGSPATRLRFIVPGLHPFWNRRA